MLAIENYGQGEGRVTGITNNTGGEPTYLFQVCNADYMTSLAVAEYGRYQDRQNSKISSRRHNSSSGK